MREVLQLTAFPPGMDADGVHARPSIVLLPKGGVPALWWLRPILQGGCGLRELAAPDFREQNPYLIPPYGLRNHAHRRSLDIGIAKPPANHSRPPACLAGKRRVLQHRAAELAVCV